MPTRRTRHNQYTPGSRTYERMRIELIESYAPGTYACHWCRGPVVSGYTCRWCECDNPSGNCETHAKEKQ